MVVVSGSTDETVKIWDLATGRELLSLRGHQSQVTTVDASSDGRFLVTASWNGAARVWTSRRVGWLAVCETTAPALEGPFAGGAPR